MLGGSFSLTDLSQKESEFLSRPLVCCLSCLLLSKPYSQILSAFLWTLNTDASILWERQTIFFVTILFQVYKVVLLKCTSNKRAKNSVIISINYSVHFNLCNIANLFSCFLWFLQMQGKSLQFLCKFFSQHIVCLVYKHVVLMCQYHCTCSSHFQININNKIYTAFVYLSTRSCSG